MSQKNSRKETIQAPDLDHFISDKGKFVSYSQGARMYSMNYYAFIKLAKQAKANMKIKKKVVVNLNQVDEYLEAFCNTEEGEDA